jgi:hypothetical protein
LVKQLEEKSDGRNFNIFPMISRCVLKSLIGKLI